MKKSIAWGLILITSSFFQCTTAQKTTFGNAAEAAAGAILNGGTAAAVSDLDIGNGLKEALNAGVTNGVNELIKTDGYFGDAILKILLPAEAAKVQDIIIKHIPGGKGLVDNAILKMNRAAEDAANEAKPIFVDAITGMSFADARGILFGTDNAATDYLRTKTLTSLTSAYSPKINAAMTKTGASQAWQAMVNPYNKIAGTLAGRAIGANTPINADLGAYVTQRALEGLFLKVTDKEKGIRKNINERVSPLLQKVFGQLDKK